MVTPVQLYEATNCGLDIIAIHFPEAYECARSKKPFKARPDERTPSASVKKYGDVWRMTDFGFDSKGLSPIDVHMNATGLNFPKAVQDLAQRFGVTDEVNRAVNRPDIMKQPASAEQEDGSVYWEIDQEFSERECKVMGPKVTAEHLKSLHWYRVKCLISVRNREATYKSSNEFYPIFMRECWFTDSEGNKDRFYKIYEPLNVDKRWRFQYQPAGKKPQKYINGLEELRAEWKKLNDDEEEKIFFKDPENEGKPYKEQKLPEAIICSGERDAICVRSLGYFPLWFNSETYRVSDDEWREINRYVDKVYNIPDIDDTGKLKGTEMALKFVDVHTVWLPEELAKYKDHRGRPRKDFRDWIELWPNKRDFLGLLELATPAKFWTEAKTKKDIKYSIDPVCLFNFLRLNGFHVLKDGAVAPVPILVHVDGSVVKPVTSRDIRCFVNQWAENTYQPKDLRNAILTTQILSQSSLSDGLKDKEIDFTNYTEYSQFFFFPKFSVEVTATDIVERDYRTSNGRYVWESNIVDHNIKILKNPLFEITHPEGVYDSESFDIQVNQHNSNYFRYLINSSRIYWRKELEEYVGTLQPDEAKEYLKAHKFDIAGPALAEDEIREQKRCLINKIFAIGFLLHRYKSESRGWAPFLMDNVIGENDQCNGRSGKSFMLRALKNLTKWLKLSGRNEKLTDSQFVFEQIDKYTDIVTVDDCHEYFPFKEFYDNITSDITINTKNVSAYTLDYSESPKFSFTTNYVPKEFDSSSVGRMLFVVFSDYYHQTSVDNDYKENRPIKADFDKDLFGSKYSDAEWEADINFMLQCVRFYLSMAELPVKIEPDMRNIIFRKNLREMSDSFRDWAESYFAVDDNGYGDHVNCDIVRLDAYEDYKRTSGAIKTSSQKFMRMLKSFVYVSKDIDELNPPEMHNSGTRILKNVFDTVTSKWVKKEVIHLRSTKEAERLRNPPQPQPEQQNLTF